MKKLIYLIIMILGITSFNSCKNESKSDFNYVVDGFNDVQILRYKVPGFSELPLQQKKLLYFLNKAALCGRDILYDQNYEYNLLIRRTFESVYQFSDISKNTKDWKEFEIYLKEMWMANGIHHHYSMDKFKPGFSKDFLREAIDKTPIVKLPLEVGDNAMLFAMMIENELFDNSLNNKRVNLKEGDDLIETSANNFYKDVSEKEVELFYNNMKDEDDEEPISYGLNSQLVKEDGEIFERIYCEKGLYGKAITQIIYWLKKAEEVAENQDQKNVISALVEFYKSGNLKDFDKYNILWLKDTNSSIDFVNGFIETYGDALGLKGSWEGIADFKNIEATKRTEAISSNAQWFEDHSPIDSRFKKEKVKGVTAKAITVSILGGDCYPATPIGINLPNSDWIRKEFGSKSVTIQNITQAYSEAAKGNGNNEEFMWSKTEIDAANKYGFLTDNLHTDLHECVGHGSGKLLPGVSPDALKSYGATIEEARADLFGLYYVADKKIVELGLLPNAEAYKTGYYSYILNGMLTQVKRIKIGCDIEESHMRNRALIAWWAYDLGKKDNVIELVKRDNKTFVKVNDYEKLRTIFGEELAEIQRIKSEGDFNAGKELVEKYGVKINENLHKEILDRFAKLHLYPYSGFVNPKYEAIKDANGNITDVKISYTEGYAEQQLRYSNEYSFLPTIN